MKDMLSFAKCLDLRENDGKLVDWVRSLGHDLKIEPDEHLGSYCMKESGVELVFKKEAFLVAPGEKAEDLYRLTSVMFFSEGFEGYKQYAGELHGGLSFAMTEKEVRTALGQPYRSAGGKQLPRMRVNKWDRFNIGERALVVTYKQQDGAIAKITLTLAKYLKK